jgi:hypothetical protein
MAKFTVWSLDVWGHATSECCRSFGCDLACISEDDDGHEVHDELTCQCTYDVNDRCRVGSVEIPDNADHNDILEILDARNFVHADLCKIDNFSDGSMYDVVSKKHNRPLLTLESEES